MKLKGLIITAGLLGMFIGARAQDANTSPDKADSKVITGRINMKTLANDSAFAWFYTGVNNYVPNAQTIRYISALRDSFNVVVFAGTWNEDTQRWLPEFYRVMMASSYPMSRIHLYGVDRKMHTPGGEEQQYHITKAPTFLFLRNGREIGRIEAHPKSPAIESDIATIIDHMMAEEQKNKATDSAADTNQ